MNYGGIEGQAIDSHEGVPLGSYNSIPSGSYVGETYPSRTYASQSYPSASIPIGQPTAVRMGAERILPKPAN